MIRLLLPLIMLPTVVWAAMPKPAMQPNPARLGEPVQIRYTLPPGNWQLPGLPDFGDLTPLGEPQISSGSLQLELLPVRPGRFHLPALTLISGGRALQTAQTELKVVDPVPADAEPAGRQALATASGVNPVIFILLALALTLAVLVAALRRRHQHSPAFLEAERRQLTRLPAGEARDRLASELDIWLYSPYRPNETEIADWWRRARQLETNG